MKVIWHESRIETPKLNKTVIGCDALRNPHIIQLVRLNDELFWKEKSGARLFDFNEIVHWAESDNPDLCMMAWSVM